MSVTAKFQECWRLLLQNEGGFTVDNGGQTRWGVTEAVARRNGYEGSMETLPIETAEAIAQSQYWAPFKCELFQTPIAFQILDTAYNGGFPVKWLQEIINGPQTGQDLADVISFMDPWEVIAKFNAKRLRYLASLRQQVYADGRMNRIAANLEKGALQ